jgi:hypothetical protein
MKIVMQKGQKYRCQNSECRAEIEVTKDSSEGALNPRCCCGAEMKKSYSEPVFRTLDEDAAVHAKLFEK